MGLKRKDAITYAEYVAKQASRIVDYLKDPASPDWGTAARAALEMYAVLRDLPMPWRGSDAEVREVVEKVLRGKAWAVAVQTTMDRVYRSGLPKHEQDAKFMRLVEGDYRPDRLDDEAINEAVPHSLKSVREELRPVLFERVERLTEAHIRDVFRAVNNRGGRAKAAVTTEQAFGAVYKALGIASSDPARTKRRRRARGEG